MLVVVGAVVARSVVRPLARLDDAAVALGGGDLDVRTDANHGPHEVQLLAARSVFLLAPSPVRNG